MNVWDGFKNFFYISKIELVLFVTKKLTAKRMENRATHGLVYYGTPYGKLTFQNTVIEPQAGQIVYLPKGSTYDISAENAAETDGCYAINFLAPDLRQTEPFVFEPKSAPTFSSLFLHAEKAWKEKRLGYEEKCFGLLYAAFAALKDGDGYSPSAYKRLLAPAEAYIHEHYAEKRIYGAELAALCGVSETYFRRLFIKVYGVTPVEYVNALRIGRAKDLLSNRGARDGHEKSREACTVSEIAELCGFSDVFYFTRLFKKFTGYTPDKWRRK